MPSAHALPTLIVALAAMVFVLWLVSFHPTDRAAFADWGHGRAAHAGLHAARR